MSREQYRRRGGFPTLPMPRTDKQWARTAEPVASDNMPLHRNGRRITFSKPAGGFETLPYGRELLVEAAQHL